MFEAGLTSLRQRGTTWRVRKAQKIGLVTSTQLFNTRSMRLSFKCKTRMVVMYSLLQSSSL